MFPVSILYKSIAGRYRPVRVADGPITVRYRFIKNASWVCLFMSSTFQSNMALVLSLFLPHLFFRYNSKAMSRGIGISCLHIHIFTDFCSTSKIEYLFRCLIFTLSGLIQQTTIDDIFSYFS